ncbi:hypothetical protein D0866_02094 [Hortaea werneckii]|uniref:Uncharacterized protein n=1 Tax=Hortaea werneckii TaxID=91943 RepID=A0A3M7BI45_HORWE|nr:hypothetical protein D0866_02094 [Hortaea werneckii]
MAERAAAQQTKLFSDPETDSDDDYSDDEGEDSSDEIADRRRNFLGRVQSYSKAMHAHTTFQLGSLSRGTLPSYTKTMHAFTLNQLNHHFNEGTTKSASNSPERGPSKPRGTMLLGPGGRTVMLTHKVWSDLSKLGLDEAPRGPSNSPVRRCSPHFRPGVDTGHLRRRSLTDPVPRGYAVGVDMRDFAVA